MRERQLALGLQGGGSHGAYTWGVLDRLLEDDTIGIEAISGASAGAMNAVVLAHGYALRGREGAREALHAFWTAVSERMTYTGLGATPGAELPEPMKAYLSMTRYFSPYQLNPLNVNPLRDILAEQVDFERLRAETNIRLFVSATRVRDGSLRLFTNAELTLEAVLASACLPSIHHTVEVDGEPYWDGGLTANPPLSPLVYQCKARDVMVIVLNPGATDTVPATADAILTRFTQVSFAAAFSNELQSILAARAEAQRARFSLGRVDRRLRRVNLHLIESGGYIDELDPATRFKTDGEFITALRDEGRARAERWLTRDSSCVPVLYGKEAGRAAYASRESECAAG